MKAIYKSRIYNVVDAAMDLTLDGIGVEPFDLSFGEPGLVVDPTDHDVADAGNLAEWFGTNEEQTAQLRRMLRGEMSLAEWNATRQRG